MTKEENYLAVIQELSSLLHGENDEIARMSNIASALHHRFGFWWTGFYRVSPENELVLGPFQGTVACLRIAFGKGVCGASLKEERTVIVPDVEKFPGHIACSSESRSEIVVPCRKRGVVTAVLDIDSERLGTFDDVDARYLERLASLVYPEEQNG